MSNESETARRIARAADFIESAVRLGAEGRDVYTAVAAAVDRGAERLAQDTSDAFREAARRG